MTKRDLFHLFHKYGKLAQISIKQAYGFIQFLDSGACYQALQAEQGGIVRGRKIRTCSVSWLLRPKQVLMDKSLQIWRYQSLREIPGRARLRLRPPVPLHRGAHDHQTLAGADRRVVVLEIAMTEPMTLEECRSVILGMSIVPEDVMTIAHRDHHLRALIAAERDIDPVIGPRTGTIDEKDVVRGRLMAESDDIGVPVPERAVGMIVIQTCLFPEEHPGMCLTCRSSSLTMWIGKHCDLSCFD